MPGDTNSACCERVGRFEEGMEDGDYLEFLPNFQKKNQKYPIQCPSPSLIHVVV